MNQSEIKQKILEYITLLCEKQNPKIRKIVEEINKVDHSLDWLEYHDMCFFDLFVRTVLQYDTPIIFAGRVADGDFKDFHDVFKLDEYENFESCYLCEMYYEYTYSADDIANRIIERFEMYDIKDTKLIELVKQLKNVE